MKIIDTRGFSCPQPVIMVTKALKANNESLKILVGSENASNNILKTLENYKLEAEISEDDGYKTFIVKRSE